jgi:hypothetical protein
VEFARNGGNRAVARFPKVGDTGLEPVVPGSLRTVSTSAAGTPANGAVEPFPPDFERHIGVPDAAVISDWELIAEAVLVARAQDTNPRTIAKYELHLGHFADVDQLKAYAKQWNIAVEWDGDALVFNGSVEHQWAILKLLDEDGTTGPVSGRRYESAAKRRVGN